MALGFFGRSPIAIDCLFPAAKNFVPGTAEPSTKTMFTGTPTFKTSTRYSGLENSAIVRARTSGFASENSALASQPSP